MVAQLVIDLADIPLLVGVFLDQFDPEIGHAHGQTVIKADPSFLYGDPQPRHAAHLFGNGQSPGVDLMDQFVGQGEIEDGVFVLLAVVIVLIGGEIPPQTVVEVEHRCHPVETEPVEPVFLLPVFQVGEEEVQHFVFTVIKAEGVPGRVLTAGPFVEILAAGTVEQGQPFHFVAYGMRMYNVHDHTDAVLMCFVDERPQVVGGAEA